LLRAVLVGLRLHARRFYFIPIPIITMAKGEQLGTSKSRGSGIVKIRPDRGGRECYTQLVTQDAIARAEATFQTPEGHGPLASMVSAETRSIMIESALRVARLGLRIHPLRRKHAILEDWPARASSDCDTIRSWLANGEQNYGIVCDLVAVIDTDSAELTAWWEKNMPPTPWRVRTPRGGMHFYYLSVLGLRNAVKARRGWDVRAGGRGYVAGAGSLVDGKAYELLGEETLDLPPFDPAWLPTEGVQPVTLPAAVKPARAKIRNLRSYIRRIVSIQGQRGSDACFRVACLLRDEGKTPDEALEYMLEWNRQCAIPPWTVKELIHKIRDSYAKLAKG
jgi:hypothetical protein